MNVAALKAVQAELEEFEKTKRTFNLQQWARYDGHDNEKPDDMVLIPVKCDLAACAVGSALLSKRPELQGLVPEWTFRRGQRFDVELGKYVDDNENNWWQMTPTFGEHEHFSAVARFFRITPRQALFMFDVMGYWTESYDDGEEPCWYCVDHRSTRKKSLKPDDVIQHIDHVLEHGDAPDSFRTDTILESYCDTDFGCDEEKDPEWYNTTLE